MNTSRSTVFASLLLFALAWAGAAHAKPPAAVPHPDSDAGAAAQTEWPEDADHKERDADSHAHDEDSHTRSDNSSDDEEDDDSSDHDVRHEHGDWTVHRHGRHHHGNSLVNFGRNSDLPAGEHADGVVSILGSSSSEGDAWDVVSIIGNTRVSGPVKHSAVAVLGNTYVDSVVGGDVVAMLGNVELGPHADVSGNVAAVGGTVTRDPGATVHGNVQSVGGIVMGFGWLQPWIDHCLLYGRPLALVPGIGWAWSVAAILLGLYVCLALLFREGVSACVRTLEMQPGMTLVAALLTMLLTPILLVLLFITVVGIAAVPLVLFAMFCAGLFGKAVILAWIGHHCTGARSTGISSKPAVAVLIGGVIVLALYLVPVLGFVVYKLLGIFGFGAVVYTLIMTARARRGAPQPFAAGPATPASPASAGAAQAAFAAQMGPAPAAGGAAAAATSAAAPPAPPPAPAITASLPRAGFWIRMAALLLDALLVGFLMGLLHHLLHLELLALAVYGAAMWKLRGSTIGGIVFDLQVVRLDGREIDWETAIVRALGCFLSLAVAGLGFFWIAFDPGKQAWHDKIAGTAVVRVTKGVPLI